MRRRRHGSSKTLLFIFGVVGGVRPDGVDRTVHDAATGVLMAEYESQVGSPMTT